MRNIALYAIAVLIWGSTWLAITYQLGEVNPTLSVAYRFSLASILLLIYCYFRGLSLRFSSRQHISIAAQGLLLFSANYLLVYLAEQRLTSGLVAVVFSMLVFMNIIIGSVILGTPVRRNVVAGAILGIAGLSLVFLPELGALNFEDSTVIGLLLALGGTLLASLGNITAARNQREGLPVIQTNAIGMGYGSLVMYLVALLSGASFRFSTTPAYIGSLLYLVVFGSIIAFGAYLTLLGRIGADRAAYVTLLFPVVALALSTVFEGYRWEWYGLLGVLLVLAGNFLALSRQSLRSRSSRPSEAAP